MLKQQMVITSDTMIEGSTKKYAMPRIFIVIASLLFAALLNKSLSVINSINLFSTNMFSIIKNMGI